MTMYRMVVCVDVEADSLEEAYEKIHTRMSGTGLAWESSDEAYLDGEPIPREEVTEAFANGPMMSNRTQEILIIAGSREGVPYEAVREVFLEWVSENGCPGTIVHGGAKGVDTYAEQLAAEFQIPVEVFRADWDKHGKKAGPIRNRQMAQHGTAALVIHTGSRGSKSMLYEAVEAGIRRVREHEVPPVDEFAEVLHDRGILKRSWAPPLHYDDRGFLRADFIDKYGMGCSIQESSIATEGCLWFGINGVPVTPQYTFRDEAGMTRTMSRMHLTQEHVRGLLPLLQLFAERGDLRR